MKLYNVSLWDILSLLGFEFHKTQYYYYDRYYVHAIISIWLYR